MQIRTGRRIENPCDGMEIRYIGDRLDEIVAHNATVHFEEMNDGQWWVGIDVGDRHFAVNLGVVNTRAKTYAFVEDFG